MKSYSPMKAPPHLHANSLREALEKAYNNGYSYLYAVAYRAWTRFIYTNDAHFQDVMFWQYPTKRYVVADEMAKLECSTC